MCYRQAVVSFVEAWSMNLLNRLPLEEEEDDDDDTLSFLISRLADSSVRCYRNRRQKLQGFAEKIVPVLNDDAFRSHFRVSLASVEMLENKISRFLIRQGSEGRSTVAPRKQILCVLWLLATPDSYRSVAEQFSMSKSTLHACFRRVVYALNKIANQEITWPTRAEQVPIKQKFSEICEMPDVIGAIDGCQIEIDAPREHPSAYRTSKKHYAMQLQAVCTANLIFVDCFTGYPGSVHDARVLRNSPLHRDSYQLFTDNSYILADKAYPIRTWCIPPYKNTGHLTERQLFFNKCHGSTRQVIERAFALLKGRFRRLKHLVMYRHDEIPYVIMASCVLHNICIRGGLEEREYLEEYITIGRENIESSVDTPDMVNDSPEAVMKRD